MIGWTQIHSLATNVLAATCLILQLVAASPPPQQQNNSTVIIEDKRTGICQRKYIRNDPSNLESLRGCRVIEGSLQLALMHSKSPEKWANYSYPELREITGYLLIFDIYHLTSLQNLFPNLAVIRGQELVDTHALVINSVSHLQEIGLPSLTDIQRGSVWIADNIQLCYVDTIDWSQITNETTNGDNGILNNKPSNQCPNWCSKTCKTSFSDSDHQRYCWGGRSSSCQKVFKNICPFCHGRPCTDSGDCCSSQCLGGCSGTSARHCHVCKHVIHNGTCKESCPSELYEYLERRCVTRENCLTTVGIPDMSKGSMKLLYGKLYESHGKKQCVLECPKDTVLAPNKTACVPCDGVCKRNCSGMQVDSVEKARELAGCTRITGVLKISIRRSSSVTTGTIVKELKQSLGKIEEIDDHLVITHTYALFSLDFLENLKLIRGNNLEDGRYALVVRSNENLMELWDSSRTIKIENNASRVLFHYNPKLCPGKIWEFVAQSDISQFRSADDNRGVDIGITNGDKVTCNTQTLNLEILKKTENTVLIRYENFRRNLTFPSHLLNYEIYYKEAIHYPEKNVTKFEDRDDWTVLEYPKISDADVRLQKKEPKWEHSRLISHLKYYTWYALYVKTVVIPDENNNNLNNNTGAESNITYFRTLPGVPSKPQEFKLVVEGPNIITLSWSLPISPNGQLEKFNIWLDSVQEDEKVQDQRNYCDLGRVNRKMHLSGGPLVKSKSPVEHFGGTLIENTRDSSAAEKACTCCPTTTAAGNNNGGEKPNRLSYEAIHYQDNMMNQIINHVFISPPHSSSSSDNHNKRSKRSTIRRSVQQDKVFPGEESSPDLLDQPKMISRQMIKVMEIKYQPGETKYSTSLKNLTHFTTYKIGIQVCREISTEIKPVDTKTCSELVSETVQTAASPTADIIDVRSISANVTEGNKLEVTWNEPYDPNGVILGYVVKVQKMDGSKYTDFPTKRCVTRKEFQTNGHYYTLPYEFLPGNYSIRIQVASLAKDSDWTEDIFVLINGKDGEVMSTLWILITLLPFLLLVAFAYRHHNRVKMERKRNKISSANPEYLSNVAIPEKIEVPREKLQVYENKELGQGSFGTVFEGLLKNFIQGRPSVRCAVKTVLADSSDDKRQFLKEAEMMAKLDCRCQHVVKLLGVVSKTQPIYVIMEFMANRDLRNYLRSRRPGTSDNAGPAPTLRQILRMAAEIADGMAYIHKLRLVHRDLAARNCMVGEDLCVRIGDFGMAKDMHQNDYYRKLNRELSPVRWMAPESLGDGIFTNKSDVWAFGVVLWEMATLAAQPYQGLCPQQVYEYVLSGRTMEKPENCPAILFEMMTSCWQNNAKTRPSFIQILERLSIILDTSFCQASFFNSPEGLRYQHQLKSQSKDEATIELRFKSLPLIRSNDNDDDDYYNTDEKYQVQHHIIDDLGDTSTQPLLSSSPNEIIVTTRGASPRTQSQFFQPSNY